MNTHRRLLSILHIVYGTLTLLVFLFISTVVNSALPFIEDKIPQNNGEVIFISIVFSTIRIFLIIIAISVPLPSIIGGIALYNSKKWGIIPLLLSGCVSLLSFPLGTGLGVYTIWYYLALNESKKNDAN
ncbi:MAG: hypothetical protein RIA69_18990 [Cyclobacteriaceae bacterium]